MGKEIERKFLVTDDRWRKGAQGAPCRQGYLTLGPPVAVRVRVMGDKGTVNIKKATVAVTRDEFEYPIPVADVEEILDRFCMGHVIEKTRYKLPYAGLTWEIDEFEGANKGLIVAEVELEDEEQAFEKPPWVGEEVSGDPRYLNTGLVRHPYTEW